MSPFRVYAVSTRSAEDGRNLAAMLSIDKVCHRRKIYITEKYTDILHLSAKEAAHMQTTRSNSEIVASYELQYADETSRRYCVLHLTSDNAHDYVVSCNEYTQADCLVAAMEDYCNQNHLTIAQVL